MLACYSKAGRQLSLLRHFVAVPQRVDVSQRFLETLKNTESGSELSQAGQKIRPEQATTAAPLVLEYATPDIISRSGFKPVMPGIIQQLQSLTAAQARADERFAAAQVQADERYSAIKKQLEIYEINLRYTKEIAVSVILRDVLKRFREVVWYSQHHAKYTPAGYNAWVNNVKNNRFADNDTVYFIDQLIKDPSPDERALLTWGFLRYQARHPLIKDSDAEKERFPTGQMNKSAHIFTTKQTAFAVTTTEVRSATIINFDMYKMMLRVNGRDDVLDEMQSSEMQMLNDTHV